MAANAPLGAVWPPTSSHGVVVSLPTLADVIAYETGCPIVSAAITCGYPRFVQHSCVRALVKACDAACQVQGLVGVCSLIVLGHQAAQGLVRYVGAGQVINASRLLLSGSEAASAADIPSSLRSLHVVLLPSGDGEAAARAKAYLQHTGGRAGSRQAEDALRALDSMRAGSRSTDTALLENQTSAEEVAAADLFVRSKLREAFSRPTTSQIAILEDPNQQQGNAASLLSEDDVLLTGSGMAAFTATFGAVRSVWRARSVTSRGDSSASSSSGTRQRHLWIQLGWLYLDTAEMIRKFVRSGDACSGSSSEADTNAADTAALEAELKSIAIECGDGRVSPAVDFDLSAGYVRCFDVGDLRPLEAVLKTVGHRVAAVVTECPTNPLVQTCDLPALSSLCRAAGCMLVVDPTMAGLGNASPLPHADVVTLSTTKYAASCGDVMSGAVVLNPASAFYGELKAVLRSAAEARRRDVEGHCACNSGSGGEPHTSAVDGDGNAATTSPSSSVVMLPPYHRDLLRLAAEIRDCDTVVSAMNRNCAGVVAWLRSHMARPEGDRASNGVIRAVHWAYSEGQSDRYAALVTDTAAGADSLIDGTASPLKPGCMVTFELTSTGESNSDSSSSAAAHCSAQEVLSAFYDACPLVKGPSFGTTFSILCPFMYLAHYDMVSCDAGRAGLLQRGLDPYLLRLSVGCEPLPDIIAALQAGVDAVLELRRRRQA